MDYTILSDAHLLETYNASLETARAMRNDAGHAEQEMYRRMEERGAGSIPSETYVCEQKPKNNYSQAAFVPLKEIFNDVDLASCWVAAHEEVVQVAEKWNTVKVKALARRYGDKAQAVVAQATLVERGVLIFQRR